ncbi:MAG TPA: proton-conducting transporter membrane subunit, partial [Ktedonobacteraceae bacterium]
MDIVAYAWLIPALPLAGFLVIVFFTRVMDVRSRPRPVTAAAGASAAGHSTGLTHAEEAKHADHGPTESSQQAATAHEPSATHDDSHASAAAYDDHSAHGSGEHGGETPFWARMSGYVSILAMLAAWVVAVLILFQVLGDTNIQSKGTTISLYNWFSFHAGGVNIDYPINFHVDSLTAVMLVVVTTVSLLVQIYSQGYMQGDPGFSRFFAWLSLFTVSMLILVLADNFLVIYIGWELVGLCSYLLIGFWYDRRD